MVRSVGTQGTRCGALGRDDDEDLPSAANPPLPLPLPRPGPPSAAGKKAPPKDVRSREVFETSAGS